MKRIIIFISDKAGDEIDRLEVNRFYFCGESRVLTTYSDIDKRMYDNVKEVCLLEKTEYDEFYDVLLDI